jgi:hypothetical protein
LSFFVKRYTLIDIIIATYTIPTPTSTLTRPKPSDPHHAAITETTLARLKKLNLKNYAAPRGYGYGHSSPPPGLTPPVLTLTSASPTGSSFVRPPPLEAPNLTLNTTLEMSSPTLSSTTSMDSTPVQTPTQGDEDDGEERWKVGGEEEEEESLRWSLGMENGHFATTLMPSPISSPATTPLGSPIPVSILGDRNTFSYTSYPKSGAVEMGTSPPFSDLKESVVVRGGGFVHWDWGTAAGVASGGGEVKKESAYEPSINLTNGGGGSGLMPPQRRRGLQQQKRGTGTGSSSGSDSNSKLPSPSTSTPIPTPPPSTTATAVTTPKQKLKPPKLDLPTPPLTPPSVTSPSGVQSPNIRRGSGPPQPQRHGHRYYQSMPSFIGSSKSPSTPGDSDAIYQALVREWCFAKGPSTSMSGETTPVLVNSPSPLGLACALGDGE